MSRLTRQVSRQYRDQRRTLSQGRAKSSRTRFGTGGNMRPRGVHSHTSFFADSPGLIYRAGGGRALGRPVIRPKAQEIARR